MAKTYKNLLAKTYAFRRVRVRFPDVSISFHFILFFPPFFRLFLFRFTRISKSSNFGPLFRRFLLKFFCVFLFGIGCHLKQSHLKRKNINSILTIFLIVASSFVSACSISAPNSSSITACSSSSLPIAVDTFRRVPTDWDICESWASWCWTRCSCW